MPTSPDFPIPAEDSTTMRRGGRRRGLVVLAAVLAPALAVSSCVQQDSGDGGGSDAAEGVPVGASKQQYVSAFEGLEPEAITIQSTSPAGEGVSVRIEEYAQELEEWSGGKLTVEIAYSNSVAAPDEAPQALAEGRLDMDYVYPLYDPSRFPKNAAFANIAFVGKDSPEVGMFSTWAGLMEAGLKEEELGQEFEQKGLKLLLPFTPQPPYGLICRKPRSTLAELKGAQVRISGGVQDEQVEALGANPTSLPYSEIFQGLQRGVIDCSVSPTSSTPPLGLAEVAPHFTTGDSSAFAPATAPYAFGLQKWESMALPYRQLIFDRLRTLSGAFLEYFYLRAKQGLDQMRAEGGEVQQLGEEADAALAARNQELLSRLEDSGTFAETEVAQDAVDAVEQWRKVALDMGLSEASFAEWAEAGEQKTDATEFVQRFWSNVASEYRPE